MVELRVYKVQFPNGYTAFQFRTTESGAINEASDVQDIAHGARLVIEKDSKPVGDLGNRVRMIAAITFSPFYDLEHWVGLDCVPVRCLPLTEEECCEFWRAYNSWPPLKLL